MNEGSYPSEVEIGSSYGPWEHVKYSRKKKPFSFNEDKEKFMMNRKVNSSESHTVLSNKMQSVDEPIRSSIIEDSSKD